MLFAIAATVKLEKGGTLATVDLPVFLLDSHEHKLQTHMDAQRVAHGMLSSVITAPSAIHIDAYEQRHVVVSHGTDGYEYLAAAPTPSTVDSR